MLSLIKSLIKSLNLYLELKSKSFYIDMLDRSKRKQKDLINEIEHLRSIGDSHATDRADFLQQELIAEKRDIKHLSAVYAPTESGTSDTD